MLDTLKDRQAAANVGFNFWPTVTPNSAKDLVWRRQVASNYSFDEEDDDAGGGVGFAMTLGLCPPMYHGSVC